MRVRYSDGYLDITDDLPPDWCDMPPHLADIGRVVLTSQEDRLRCGAGLSARALPTELGLLLVRLEFGLNGLGNTPWFRDVATRIIEAWAGQRRWTARLRALYERGLATWAEAELRSKG